MSKYTISCIQSTKENPTNESSLFAIEPLEVGHGITLGNALRRTLLSDLTGYAITAFRINNLQHEFAVLPSLREDSMEIMLNLKQVVFKGLSNLHKNYPKKLRAVIAIKGPVVVTASKLLLPYPYLTILNPNQYICTIVDNSTLYLEIDIEQGKAYKLAQQNRRNYPSHKVQGKGGKSFVTDSLFSPIKNVNYKIKLIHDTKGNIKESLLFEITTNGSISPKRAFQESSKLLLELFAPLLIDKYSCDLSNQFSLIENVPSN